ncbi:MAG: response regulator transcription factor [Bacteroidota bacterium]
MEKQPQVLMVDDERQFSAMTQEYLEAKGFEVILKHSGDEGLAAFKKGEFDICILDVKMPMKDGFTLAAEIRELDDATPIIFLTGQTEKEDRIKGLTIGADDYVTKPFSVEELFLRIKNILKRSSGSQNKIKKQQAAFNIGKYHLNANTRELTMNDNTLKLTAIETKLLQMFCENEEGMVERNLALKRIWGDEDYLRGRSLNVYVSKLRQYLKEDKNIEIMNVHGVGYRMVVR